MRGLCRVVGLLLVVSACGCASAGLPLRRFGLPEGYPQPVNVRNWNKETICVLWPDNHLEYRAPQELVVRTLIDQRLEVGASASRVLGAAKKQSGEIVKQAGQIKRLSDQVKGLQVSLKITEEAGEMLEDEVKELQRECGQLRAAADAVREE